MAEFTRRGEGCKLLLLEFLLCGTFCCFEKRIAFRVEFEIEIGFPWLNDSNLGCKTFGLNFEKGFSMVKLRVGFHGLIWLEKNLDFLCLGFLDLDTNEN